MASPAQAGNQRSPVNAFHDTSATPPSLHSVHQAVETTWLWQDRLGEHRARYYYVADRRTTPRLKRWHIATAWWAKARAAYDRAHATPAASGNVPGWFVSAASCISAHEEYGYSGGTTIAGYFGFIYPPSSYQSPGPSIAATYGDSWLSVPLSAQLGMAYSLYQSYGWSPWSTAPGCGL